MLPEAPGSPGGAPCPGVTEHGYLPILLATESLTKDAVVGNTDTRQPFLQNGLKENIGSIRTQITLRDFNLHIQLERMRVGSVLGVRGRFLNVCPV